LHPVALTEAGLAAALSELVSASPVHVALDVPPARFPAPVEVAAYFVCAEAVANAAKHARCGRVDVEVAASSDTLRVRVRDDGRGGASPAGSGLLGLRDRVEAIGGRLSVESRASAGTRVEARLPLR
jgi:signal transduction histidine kinase